MKGKLIIVLGGHETLFKNSTEIQDYSNLKVPEHSRPSLTCGENPELRTSYLLVNVENHNTSAMLLCDVMFFG